MKPNPPIIVAHRGLHHSAIENTLDAFIAATHAKIPWSNVMSGSVPTVFRS